MTEITAKIGTYLTQTAIVPNDDRIFVSKVYTNDESLWRLASSDEVEVYLAAAAKK